MGILHIVILLLFGGALCMWVYVCMRECERVGLWVYVCEFIIIIIIIINTIKYSHDYKYACVHGLCLNVCEHMCKYAHIMCVCEHVCVSICFQVCMYVFLC